MLFWGTNEADSVLEPNNLPTLGRVNLLTAYTLVAGTSLLHVFTCCDNGEPVLARGSRDVSWWVTSPQVVDGL